jgi:hypothetical protein
MSGWSFNGASAAQVNFWVLIYVVLGGVAFVSNFMHRYYLGVAGERLTRRCVRGAILSVLS